MSGTAAAAASRVPGCCNVIRCNRDRCGVNLKGAPKTRLLVDMGCDALKIPVQRERCDYLFIGEEGNTTWVAPIELKSGRLKATEVLEQIEGGVREVEPWLPQGISFQLVPVLVHGKAIHRNELKKLLSRKIQLRGRKKLTVLMKCGEALTTKLRADPSAP